MEGRGGREDETWGGGKVRIGGLVSSIPGEKIELPPVTGWGGKGPEYHNEIKRYIMVIILTFDV